MEQDIWTIGTLLLVFAITIVLSIAQCMFWLNVVGIIWNFMKQKPYRLPKPDTQVKFLLISTIIVFLLALLFIGLSLV